jgi:hypothetical protein
VFEKSLFSTSGISFSDLIEEVLSRTGWSSGAYRQAVQQRGGEPRFLPDLPYSAVEAVKVPTEHEVWGKTVIKDPTPTSYRMSGKGTVGSRFRNEAFKD